MLVGTLMVFWAALVGVALCLSRTAGKANCRAEAHTHLSIHSRTG